MTTTQITRLDEKGIALNSVQDVMTYAATIIATSLCPKQYVGKAKDAMIAILAGRAVGLNPLQSLTGIAVINGRATMYGEARTAVIYGGGQVEWVNEWFEIDGEKVNPNYKNTKDFPDNLFACWQAKRKDNSKPTPVVRFSVGDAKIAGLWEKKGRDGGATPWCYYPLRMLHMRARAFGEKDYFADALAGIGQAEEVMYIPRHAPDPLEAEIMDEPVLPEMPPDMPPTKGPEGPPIPENELFPSTAKIGGHGVGLRQMAEVKVKDATGWTITDSDFISIRERLSGAGAKTAAEAEELLKDCEVSIDENDAGEVRGVILSWTPQT